LYRYSDDPSKKDIFATHDIRTSIHPPAAVPSFGHPGHGAGAGFSEARTSVARTGFRGEAQAGGYGEEAE
jgi:hypothetical protein